MKPKISIIVPIYNVEKYLRRCVDSILEQTFKDIEIILVNDGSTDRSGEICNRYINKDSRVKVIHKENGGLSSARNAGIDIAIGDYIGFVDSDDWIDSNMYNHLYNLCEENNADIVECSYDKVFDDYIIKKDTNEKIVVLNNIQALESLYINTFYGSVVSWNKLYKAYLFKDIRFPIGKLNEDQFITYKLYYQSTKVVFTNKELYYYYQGNESITRSKFCIKKLDAIEAIEEARKFYKEKNLYKLMLLNDTLYSFVLIKYYNILLKEDSKYSEIRKEIKGKYRSLFKEFINNIYINKKSKILLIIFNISPKLYNSIFYK